MVDTGQQATGIASGKGLVALLVGVLLMVVAGTVAAYWARSKGAEAAKPRAVAAAPAGAPTTAPAAAPAASRAVATAPRGAEVTHADVYFDFKSTRLRADAVRLLEEKAALMDRADTWAVLVQGYADRQGPPEYNKGLARRRAEAVKQFLVELGVPEASVKIVTIGQDGSVCDELRPECQRLNRRVHLEIRKLARASAAPARAVTAHDEKLDRGSNGAALP
jgi:outer membrane protein OmpA-like peptidoglycan-associated protein